MKRKEFLKKSVVGGSALALGVKGAQSFDLGTFDNPVLINKENIVEYFEYIGRMLNHYET